ncbi:diguanylate cyclase [Thiomicrorhabdus sp.]|uniref:GGDEF domain-containing protein n=1 Tax=Thiomicrorhabdus sp. TaxID=2039724 RepID=UPI0035632089
MHMPRITSKIFTDQFIWMVTLGLVVGFVFPPFMILLGIPEANVMTPLFYTASLMAGFFMGVMNFGLVHFVVRPHLKELADRMMLIKGTVNDKTYQESDVHCMGDSCFIEAVSDDEFGESARAFNEMVEALQSAHEVEYVYTNFSKALSSNLELEGLAKEAIHLLIEHTVCSAGGLFVEDEGEMKMVYAQGIVSAEQIVQHDYIIKAMDDYRIERITLPENIEVDGLLTHFRPQEIVVVPILFKQQNLGVFVLASPVHINDQSISMINMFRQGMGLALNNAMAHESLQRLAALDGLTNVYNRRFGLKRLKEEFKRTQRNDSPLGVLMIDIDHFKNINDAYGHLVGDKAIVLVTKTILNTLREGDVLARYGGEEFLVILPGASEQNCWNTAERIRRVVEDSRLKINDQEISFTVSLGYISFPKTEVADEMELLHHADQALYQAKDGGRNRIVAYSDLLPESKSKIA